MKTKEMWKHTDGKLVDVEPGVRRRCLARGKDMLTVYYEFDKGAGSDKEEDMHNHPQAQTTYIVSGKFIFNVNGNKYTVEAGDSLYNLPNVPHTAVCLEAGTLVDVFSPDRIDIIPEDER